MRYHLRERGHCVTDESQSKYSCENATRSGGYSFLSSKIERNGFAVPVHVYEFLGKCLSGPPTVFLSSWLILVHIYKLI